MKLKNLPECARPLYFENKSDDFPYSFGCSCFFIKYNNVFYAVSVRHVYANLQYDVTQTRIPPNLTNIIQEFVSFDKIIKNTVYENDDKTKWYADIIIFRIPSSKLKPEYDFNAYGLSRSDMTFNCKIGGRLLIRGYPSELAGNLQIDFKSRILKPFSITITGSYKRDMTFPMCHYMKFDDFGSSVKDTNGMSGSPVFQVVSLCPYSAVRLAGIYIAADKHDMRLGCFIDTRVLLQMFDKINV